MADNGNLTRLLECPVCFERLNPPIQTCKRGHPICQKCKKTINLCPICRGEYSLFKNSFLDQLVESIPISCRYKKMGCNESFSDTAKHEIVCDYRPVSCIWHLQCGKKDVVFCEYNKHLEIVHQPYTKKIHLGEENFVTVQTKPQSVKPATIILCDEKNQVYFIRRCVVDLVQNTFFVSVHYIGKSTDANKYMYKVKIDQGMPAANDAYYSYSAYCLPYIETTSSATSNPHVNVLDTKKIFLTDKYLSEVKYSVTIRRVISN